nr:geranylgeranylglyceryl/heptaprenylglyceryl phosphate synthase [Nannocystis sp. SCPEA4]
MRYPGARKAQRAGETGGPVVEQDRNFVFERYLPLLDPDSFSDLSFYRELERIGYRQVLLGGTGAADLPGLTMKLKEHTRLQVVLYPAGPDSLAPADVVLLPDVMNSNSHYARPFGSGSVATAMHVARRGLNFIPLAYFIMGNSTARWYFDAFVVSSPKIILGYANYARMVGYRYLALDYEDPALAIDPNLISALKQVPGLHLVISDEFDPASGRQALRMGADTVVTPSDIFEDASDPLRLAREFHDALLVPS